jgi:hypothetical protein
MYSPQFGVTLFRPWVLPPAQASSLHYWFATNVAPNAESGKTPGKEAASRCSAENFERGCEETDGHANREAQSLSSRACYVNGL